MSQQPDSGRSHGTWRFAAVCLALVLVVSGLAVGVPGPAVGTTAPTDARSTAADHLDGFATEHDITTERDNVSVEIDCNESEVRVTAPEQFEYTLRVSNVVVTPERSEVLTTTTTESGNATVSLTESAPVYVFVSTGAGLATSAFENCALVAEQANATTTTTEPAPASVTVDCNASEVRVGAPADFSYTVQVSNIVVTPESTQVSTTGLSASGNATVSVGDAGAVAAFVSNETGTVVSTFENCEFEAENRTTTRRE